MITTVRRFSRPLPGLLPAVLLVTLSTGCARPEAEFARGGGTSWSEYQGEWVLINYWAEWCAPCREEIPELNRLHEEGGDMGVTVLGVNFDGLKGEALTSLMDEMDIQFPVLVNDPRQRWDQPQPSVLPSTFVIDPDGNLHDVLVGPQTYESLARAVEASSEV